MKKIWIAVTLFAVIAVIVAIGIPTFQFQREKSRRRHQIGQLWMLIRLYYEPAHDGRYPNELAELTKLPQYVAPFFDRAIREIELVTPGIEQNTSHPYTLVLRERSVDRRGYIWVHLLDGAILYRKPSTYDPLNQRSD
jgi:hypothetical protein